MKELTCPNCNRTFLPETLSDYDFNFLKEYREANAVYVFTLPPLYGYV